VFVKPAAQAETLHRGRHAKMFRLAKSAAHDRCFTSDLWPISHNIVMGEMWDKQKSLCDVCNIQ